MTNSSEILPSKFQLERNSLRRHPAWAHRCRHSLLQSLACSCLALPYAPIVWEQFFLDNIAYYRMYKYLKPRVVVAKWQRQIFLP